MALCLKVINAPKINYCSAVVFHLFKNIYCKHYSNNLDSSTNLDALDNFTTDLMLQKLRKWKNLQLQICYPAGHNRSRSPSENLVNCNSIIRSEMAQVTIDAKMLSVLESCMQKKIHQAIDECLVCKKLPSLPVLKQYLFYLCQNGDDVRIKYIIDMCHELIPHILDKNSNFEYYIAHAVWIKGDTLKALDLFDKIYRSNKVLRQQIQKTLHYLVRNRIGRTERDTLVNITDFVENLVRDLDDNDILVIFWQACFMSDWFNDQNLSFEILFKYPYLMTLPYWINHLPFIMTGVLKKHNTNLVYRLLEVFIHYDDDDLIATTLKVLFDYRIEIKDIINCREIVKWSKERNVKLSSYQYEKFIILAATFNSDEIKLIDRKLFKSLPSRKPKYKF